jgi:hypothetical protein
VILSVLLVASPSAAAAQTSVVVHQRLVGLLNPFGVEHMIGAGVRTPLGDPNELLFTGAHLDAGVINYTSPVYSTTGGYLELSPLAFLVLRAELAGIVLWPIGMDGGGYYALDRYAAATDQLSAEDASFGSGFTAQLGATLQGAVPIGPTRLIGVSQLAAEYFSMGQGEYWWHPRYDIVLARSDWTLGLSSMLLLEVPLDTGVLLRVGGYDDLRCVPGSDYLANQTGGIAALSIENPSAEVAEVMPFVRAGAFTDHPAREGDWTMLAGVTVRYALGTLE